MTSLAYLARKEIELNFRNYEGTPLLFPTCALLLDRAEEGWETSWGRPSVRMSWGRPSYVKNCFAMVGGVPAIGLLSSTLSNE